MDHAEIIERLRDIHPPSMQSFYALILMSVLGCASAIFFFKLLFYFNASYYPLRHAALINLKKSRLMAPPERLATQSRLLRDLVYSIDAKLSFLHGDLWLEQLDRVFMTHYFTDGLGRIYGEDLYQKADHIAVDVLDRELEKILGAFKK